MTTSSPDTATGKSHSKRIALIGNMNNNYFAVCRYLRDYGYEAHLFLLDEQAMFLPECDSFSEDYKTYTHATNWHTYYFFDPQLKTALENDLKEYDFIIGCDYAPAYMALINRKLDIFTPYGGDIVYHAVRDISLSLVKKIYRAITFKMPIDPANAKVNLQKQGIRETRLMISGYMGEVGEKIIKENFSALKRIQVEIPMVYDVYKHINAAVLDKVSSSPQLQAFEDIVRENKTIFISQMRQSWVTNTEEDPTKGNDVIIKAFASFLNKYPGKAILVLFRYGTNVKESEQLIVQLGITDHIAWLPKMPRKYIMHLLRRCDLCIASIVIPYLTSGSVLEPILAKTPLVHNYISVTAGTHYSYLYNCFEATNEQELTKVMTQVHNKDFDRTKMVEDSYKWYHDEIVERYISIVGELISKP